MLGMSIIKQTFLSTFFVAAVLALGGCGKVDQAFDCNQICNRYSDCFDENYDVSQCKTDCRDNAAADDTYADKASACETCLDDKSCTGSFACVDECVGIVP